MNAEPPVTMIVRETQEQPTDNLSFAIFVTVCCCLVFGIVSVIKASKARSLFSVGDYEGGRASAKEAHKWGVYGFIFGIIIWIAVVIFNVV